MSGTEAQQGKDTHPMPSRARRIDTHQHLVPPRYADWMQDKGIRPGGVDLPSW